MEDRVRQIKDNFDRINEIIIQESISAGRKPGDVRLIVVSKDQPVDVTEAAILAGASHLGENYPQEAEKKINSLHLYDTITWHMIGHVQSRKARIVAEKFQMLHTLDSLHLAEKLERNLLDYNKRLPVLIECNVSNEVTKSGFAAWDENAWDQLDTNISTLASYPHLEIKGLMSMPPLFEDPEQTRPYFIKLRRLRDYLAGKFKDVCWDELSIGTSTDYRVAISEGATYVRVGQAILGPRQKKIPNEMRLN